MRKVLSLFALAAVLGGPAMAGQMPDFDTRPDSVAATRPVHVRIAEGRLVDAPALPVGVPTRVIFSNDSSASGQILLGKALHSTDGLQSGESSRRSWVPLPSGGSAEVVVMPDHAGRLPVTLVGFNWLPGAAVASTYLEAEDAGQSVATLPQR